MFANGLVLVYFGEMKIFILIHRRPLLFKISCQNSQISFSRFRTISAPQLGRCK